MMLLGKTKKDMKALIDILLKWMNECGLQLNHKKSKLISLHDSPLNEYRNIKALKCNEYYKYLGYLIKTNKRQCPNFDMEHTITNISKTIKKEYRENTHFGPHYHKRTGNQPYHHIGLDAKIHIINATITAKLPYYSIMEPPSKKIITTLNNDILAMVWSENMEEDKPRRRKINKYMLS